MRGGDPGKRRAMDAPGAVFPACAGVILNIIEKKVKDLSIPRMRGGDPY